MMNDIQLLILGIILVINGICLNKYVKIRNENGYDEEMDLNLASIYIIPPMGLIFLVVALYQSVNPDIQKWNKENVDSHKRAKKRKWK